MDRKNVFYTNSTQYHELLEQTAQYAQAYIKAIHDQTPFPGKNEIQALERFNEELPEHETEASAVIKELSEIGAPGTTAENGGRFFGFVNGGLLPVAHAAEWLADTWNQNSALYVISPVASKLETVCERWVVQLFPPPDH